LKLLNLGSFIIRKKLFKSRGLTILEVILATTIFSLLSSLIFYIFAVSSQSWLKTRQTVEVKESAQVVLTRIEKELRSSAYSSLEIIEYPDPNNNSISFLSGQDSTGKTEFDEDSGKVEWKKYIIFYLEDDPKVVKAGYYQLFSKEVSLGEFVDEYSTESIEFLPYPPLKANDGKDAFLHDMLNYLNGTLAPMTYMSSPRPVAKNIKGLTFTQGTRDVSINIKTGKPVNPRDPSSRESPEKFDLTGVVVLRNI